MGFSVKWLGHASFQITSNGRNIYIDPYDGEYNDKADLVLVTHSHHDHCDPSKIERVRKEDTTIIAPADCRSKIGGRMETLKPGERFTLRAIIVEAVEAYNYTRFRSPGVPFHPRGLGVGYLITVDGKTIYHAGDTDFIPEMKQLKNIYLALLPTGGTYTMNDLDASEAVLAINPEVVISMHMWDINPEVFKKRVESRSDVKVVILKPGEQFEAQ